MEKHQWMIAPALQCAMAAAVIVVLCVRLLLSGAGAHDVQWISGLSLQLLFPALLAIVMLRSPPTKSAEGSVLKLACSLHFILMLCLPPFALHLLLGFPVVFLVIEFMCNAIPERRLDPLLERLLRRTCA